MAVGREDDERGLLAGFKEGREGEARLLWGADSGEGEWDDLRGDGFAGFGSDEEPPESTLPRDCVGEAGLDALLPSSELVCVSPRVQSEKKTQLPAL